MVSVQVKDRTGEIVGTLTDSASFLAWRRDMRKKLGGNVAAAVDENHIVDSAKELEALPEGSHSAALVQKKPVPKQARSKWRGCDLRKAV